MKLIYNDDLSLVIIMSAKEKTEQEAFLNALLDEEINEPDQVLKNNRNYIGIEISQEYVDTINKRLPE